MKKFLTLFAVLAMFLFAGCEENGEDNINPNNKTEQPEEKPNDGNEGGNEDANNPEEEIPENIFFALDKEKVSISPDGGSVDVTVYSNYKWDIAGAVDWCTLSTKSGEANEDGQVVTFSAELTYDTPREATYWFRCGNKQISLVVTQNIKEVIVADDNNTFNIPAEGALITLEYQTSVDCDVVIPEDAKSWITITPATTRALVTESVNLDVAENTSYSARIAVVKVVKKGDDSLYAEYTINQEQNDAIIAGKTKFALDGWGASISIEWESNVECEVIIPEDTTWISFSPETRALIQNKANLDIASNENGVERSATIKVVAVNNSDLFAEYTITQSTVYCIRYKTTDGNAVTPYTTAGFGANIISNIYERGNGVIEFDAPITSITNKSFYQCSTLSSITIPDSVTSIGMGAFRDCTSLASVTIGNGVTSIGGYAFRDCTSLRSVTIPDSVTEIGDYAFYNCWRLTSITIPDGVTSIGDYAFEDCKSLTSITIPDGVTSIGDYAFSNCSNLASVTIGNSVTSIGKYAFYKCSSLTKVYCNAITPPSLGYYAFRENAMGRIFYVPKEAVSNYWTVDNNWDSYDLYITNFGGTPLKVGTLVDLYGAKGVVFYIDIESSTIRIVSVSEPELQLSQDKASEWCKNYGAYWYLPSMYSLEDLYNVRSTINATLRANDYTTLDGLYWSSTEYDYFHAYTIDLSNGDSYTNNKYNDYNVRAVLAF